MTGLEIGLLVVAIVAVVAALIFLGMYREERDECWYARRQVNQAIETISSREESIRRLRDDLAAAVERAERNRLGRDEVDQRYRALRSIVIDFVRLRSKPLTVQWDKRQGAHGERLYFVYDPQTRKATLATLDEFDPAVIGAPKEL